jgi:hypothetical protein
VGDAFQLMKRKTSNNSLGAAVSAFLATYESDKVPEGFRTVSQWSPLLKVNSRQTHNILSRLCRVSHVEKASFRIRQRSFIRPVDHYRMTKAALKALGLTHLKR